MRARSASAAVLTAVIALSAPVALADGPGTGDQSPSYGGNANDHTAPYLRATLRTKHLGTLARSGKVKLLLASSEASLVGLSGTLTARAPHAKTLKLNLKGTSLLFRRAGQKNATLTLSSASRTKLLKSWRHGGKKVRGTVLVTGLGADGARNKRHLSKSGALAR